MCGVKAARRARVEQWLRGLQAEAGRHWSIPIHVFVYDEDDEASWWPQGSDGLSTAIR